MSAGEGRGDYAISRRRQTAARPASPASPAIRLIQSHGLGGASVVADARSSGRVAASAMSAGSPYALAVESVHDGVMRADRVNDRVGGILAREDERAADPHPRQTVKIRRADRGKRAARGERFEGSLVVGRSIDQRMADLRAVQTRERRLIEGGPELAHRMCGDGDAALPVHLIGLVRHAHTRIDDAIDADRDDVMVRREDLLAHEHGRAADETREPARDLRIGHLVVRRDRDRVQSLPLGLEHEPPWRQRAVAPRRAVDVKVGREHAVPAEIDRRADGRAIRHPAGQAGDDEQDRRDTPEGHRSPSFIASPGRTSDQMAMPRKYATPPVHAIAR